VFEALALANLQNRFVALLALLISKGVFTIEEYEAMVATMKAALDEEAADVGGSPK
jgi:hypothetical protein